MDSSVELWEVYVTKGRCQYVLCVCSGITRESLEMVALSLKRSGFLINI